MGGAKRLLDEYEDKQGAAIAIAVRAGVLKVCPVHETVLSVGCDPLPAYKLANTLVSEGDPMVAVFGGERRELTDFIKAATEEHDEKCYACQKYFDD